MNTDTPTPRTDDVCFTDGQNIERVDADFARQLERELNEAKAGLAYQLNDTEYNKRLLALEAENESLCARLNDANAREAQLRAALQALYDLGSLELPDSRNRALRDAHSALTLHAPPVVPAEDVKPLVEASTKIVKEQFYPMSKRLTTDAGITESALTTFTAKHKL